MIHIKKTEKNYPSNAHVLSIFALVPFVGYVRLSFSWSNRHVSTCTDLRNWEQALPLCHKALCYTDLPLFPGIRAWQMLNCFSFIWSMLSSKSFEIPDFKNTPIYIVWLDSRQKSRQGRACPRSHTLFTMAGIKAKPRLLCLHLSGHFLELSRTSRTNCSSLKVPMCYLLFLSINSSSWSGFVTQLPRVHNPIYFWYELTETEAEFQWLELSLFLHGTSVIKQKALKGRGFGMNACNLPAVNTI